MTIGLLVEGITLYAFGMMKLLDEALTIVVLSIAIRILGGVVKMITKL